MIKLTANIETFKCAASFPINVVFLIFIICDFIRTISQITNLSVKLIPSRDQHQLPRQRLDSDGAF